MFELDHLAISATDLDDGAASVSKLFGVPFQSGGQHAAMGTHNQLLSLGDLYLEVISIDPSADAPKWPRWFDLDEFTGAPCLSNWICRTENLVEARKTLPESGASVSIKRGDLRWKMAVPEDGKLPYDNCHPALIEWEGALHPATMLTPQPLRLIRLSVYHPRADELEVQIAPYLKDKRIEYVTRDTSGLEAEFETPSGTCVLT